MMLHRVHLDTDKLDDIMLHRVHLDTDKLDDIMLHRVHLDTDKPGVLDVTLCHQVCQ
jgi:hypothetical protein